MGRVLAVDYGLKRTGLAVTDPLQIIASALVTVPTAQVLDYIKQYTEREPVDALIIGIPHRLNNEPGELVPFIEKFIEVINKAMPGLPIHKVDERFTSKMAFRSLIESGQSRKTRRDKSVIDRVSATILLQWWLQQKVK